MVVYIFLLYTRRKTMEIKIPDGYKSILSVYDTQKAISLLKRLFEDRLEMCIRDRYNSHPVSCRRNA